MAMVVVDGKLRSMSEGARGASPADALSTPIQLVWNEFLPWLDTKPLYDGVLSDLAKMESRGAGSPPTTGDGGCRQPRCVEGPRACLYFCFDRVLCANMVGQLSSVPVSVPARRLSVARATDNRLSPTQSGGRTVGLARVSSAHLHRKAQKW
ncbi:unnamed protein product [Urochloa humidicola]